MQRRSFSLSAKLVAVTAAATRGAKLPRRRAFSLVELLVAMSVLMVMTVMIFQVTRSTADIWRNSSGKIEGFRNARGVYETVTRMVSQATLNTYFDYVDATGNFRDTGTAATVKNFTPAGYARRSDLHFISGKALLPTSVVPNTVTHSVFFHAPLGYSGSNTDYTGMSHLLNACGLYVCYGKDPTTPSFLPTAGVSDRYRFRLMQFLQPSDKLETYDTTITGNSSSWNNKNWFLNAIQTDVNKASPTTLSQLADNVVALVILPKYSVNDQAAAGTALAPDYEYDSRNSAVSKTFHQMPPVVEVVMVVIDEASALKLGNTTTPPNLGLATLFQDSSILSDDLKTLEANLSALPGNPAGNKIPLRFQIFQSAVSVRGAKWSTEE
ncbi:MAG: Verru_Chthon cassette protein C [Candidatus Methylacidiphilales bacterium]